MNRTRIVLVALGFACTCVLTLAACGGSSTTTLRGTFVESTNVNFQNVACGAEVGNLKGVKITVAVDNVQASSVLVRWSGKPRVVGKYLIDNSPVLACTGTWEVTIPTARVSYALGVTGLDGVSGTVTVPTNKAGDKIALDDNSATDANGDSTIEQSNGA